MVQNGFPKTCDRTCNMIFVIGKFSRFMKNRSAGNIDKVSFNDIQLQPVVFKFQKNELTGRSLDALTNLLSYVKEDKSISSVTIRAFSYDMKDKDECISMAKDRADLLKKYFKDAGFDEKAVNVVRFIAMTAQNVDEALEPDTSPEARNGIIELIRDERSGSRIDDLDLPDVGAGSNE